MSDIFAVIHYPGKDALLRWRGQSTEQVGEFLESVGMPYDLISEQDYMTMQDQD